MSSYIVPTEQIIHLTAVLLTRPFMDTRPAGLVAVARRLARENARSTNYRYRETETDVLADWSDAAVADAIENACTIAARADNTVRLLKFAQNLAYQSCDHDEWATSAAKLDLDGIVNALINRLPGYADAPWGWSERADVVNLHGAKSKAA